jgi:hypothetical protein
VRVRTGLVLLLTLTSACVDLEAGTEAANPPACADVIAVRVTQVGDNTYDFAATIRSPDEGWDKYADSFEVRSSTGEILGTRELTHPHVDEQPFTRSLTAVDIGSESSVEVVASDSVEGFCGVGQVMSFED